ncbi:MAG TPA: RecQ family ATP-dependent DNA helicase [Candidatus Acidoferrales bacterium]|nr:RecQ family ATP-dependent DNA helicase [Candidatus Acidoferrales bacterium]
MVRKRTKKDLEAIESLPLSDVDPTPDTSADATAAEPATAKALGRGKAAAKPKKSRVRKAAPKVADEAIAVEKPTKAAKATKAAATTRKAAPIRKPRATKKKIAAEDVVELPAVENLTVVDQSAPEPLRLGVAAPEVTPSPEPQPFEEVLGEHKELPDLPGELLGLALPAAEPVAARPVVKPVENRPRELRQPQQSPRPPAGGPAAMRQGQQPGLQPGQPERSGSRRSRRRRRRGRKGGNGQPGHTVQPQQQQAQRPDDRPTDPAHMAARRLGIDRLYPEQERTIVAALNGRDVLVVQPTGFGKSACYQIPSMMLPRPVVLVSPLLALLRDQHEKLLKRNIPVERIDGTIRGVARREALQRVAAGGSLLVMTTPETLANEELGAVLQQSGISLAAVDEAHCISEWGHDFRPAYMRLGERLRELGSPPVLGLTATATQTVRDDIVRYLGMRDPEVVASSPHRAILAFEVMQIGGASRLRAMTRFIKRLQRPGIIYCATTKMVDDIYGALRLLRLPVHRYHGRMAGKDRNNEQEMYMRPKRRTIMVATSAFGLGIDKPDIRYIVHAQAPASLEQYVQEAGRAGRDGRKANCVLLYDPADREVHEVLQQTSRIRPDQLYRISSALAAYAAEGRQPDLEGLTLSAQLGDRQVQALLVVLEEAGLIEMQEGSIRVTVPASEFEEQARSLAGRFVTLRTQDGRRLDRLSEYVNSKECRAIFLRRYFGEADGEACGLCDICRGAKERPITFFQPIARPEPRRRGRKRRRRRRGRGGQGGGGGAPTEHAPTGPGPAEGTGS